MVRPKEEWIPIEVPAIIDQETWDQAREPLQRNKERAPRNNKERDYLLKGLLVCGRCQLRMHGQAGDPARCNRRYLCSHKESHHAGAKCLNRTVNFSKTPSPIFKRQLHNDNVGEGREVAQVSLNREMVAR